ncbi:MAG TPA: MFS transporter [Trebonia sp.]|jgi:DHA2 family methylenomycin A resistance protein-like MFS transporter
MQPHPRLAGPRPAAPSPPKPRLILFVMCAGMFLILLDVTVVSVAVPSITAGLGTGTAGVQWVVDAYTVSLASLLLAGGTIGDRTGHRTTVLAGLVIFGVASAACGLATVPGALIAARAGQGVGAALLLPGSMAAIADAFPGQAEQARALGTWAAVSSLALPAGPLLGGLLVSALGWRAVFWINPPVVTLCVLGVLAWTRAPAGARNRDRRLDLPGLALATLTLAAAVYAVIAGGEGTWPAVAVAAPVAVAALIALVSAERLVASPLLPPPVFASPAFRVANLSALIMNLTSNGLLFVLTRYLQSVQGRSALEAGLMMLAMSVPVPLMPPAAARVTARRGPVPVLLTGAVLAGAGQLGLLAVGASSSYVVLLPALVLVGAGIGIFVTPAVAMAVRAVPPDRSGLASGINNTARQTGTALGVAVFGAVAGSPARVPHFMAAMHALGIAAAVAWLAAIAMIVAIRARGSVSPEIQGGETGTRRR